MHQVVPLYKKRLEDIREESLEAVRSDDNMNPSDDDVRRESILNMLYVGIDPDNGQGGLPEYLLLDVYNGQIKDEGALDATVDTLEETIDSMTTQDLEDFLLAAEASAILNAKA